MPRTSKKAAAKRTTRSSPKAAPAPIEPDPVVTFASEPEPTPKPAPRPAPKAKPRRRDLGGTYVAQANILRNGLPALKPGERVVLTDSEARHYLKFQAIEPVED